MEKAVENIFHRFSALLLFLFIITASQAEDGGVLNREVKLSKTKGTIYQLLKQVSDQSGYLFIYDSQIIDNDKVVKVKKGNYTVREAIYAITEDDKLRINIVGNHILLRKDNEEKQVKTVQLTDPAQDKTTAENKYLKISGILYDRITDEPVIYASASINYTSIGTITNQNGEFQLIIPDSLRQSIVKFSHVGYQNQEIEASLLENQHVRISLDPKIISLQEIVIRVVNPLDVLQKMEEQAEKNYSSKPVYMTTFYREGTEYKNKNIDLTESVIQIYKTGYKSNVNSDQTKLVKMRRIVNRQTEDTLFTKMKSGVYSSLTLDIIKESPDFLNFGNGSPYQYTHTDISVIDNRRVNVISFEQLPYTEEPLFKGQLYIDAENYALVEARFEVNPKYVHKATNWYIERLAPNIKLTLQEVKYIVSYRPADDGKYYVSHVRGDLKFKVRKKNRWFSAPLHLWFEMVNCKTETENVKGFSRRDRLSPRKILSDTKYRYDKSFWEHFNVILPEDKLKETILNNLNEITETTSSEE